MNHIPFTREQLGVINKNDAPTPTLQRGDRYNNPLTGWKRLVSYWVDKQKRTIR